MRIVITGGAGFIGTHLVAALLREGHQVVVYDNFFTGHPPELLPWRRQVTMIRGSVLDLESMVDALREFQPELLFHLAAIHYIPYCNGHPSETMRVNVEGTVNVMLALQECRCLKGVFFASSAAVYDTSARFHQESEQCMPSDVYGLSKVLGERVVQHYAAESGISWVLGRFFNVYGPRETNPHVVPAVLKQIMETGTVQMGRIDTFRDFIYIDDLVQALLQITNRLASGPVQEIYNLASGHECSIADVVKALGELAGVSPRIVVEERYVRRDDRRHLRADVTKALRELNWKPEFFIERGLEATLQSEIALFTGSGQ